MNIPATSIFFTQHDGGVVTYELVMSRDAAPDSAVAAALAAFVAVPRLVEGLDIKPVAKMAPELREVLRP